MSGKDQKTGSVPVQPIDTAIGKGFPFLFKIIGAGVGECIVKISLRGMNRHPRRFIDNEQILIFIYNGKRERRRDNPF